MKYCIPFYKGYLIVSEEEGVLYNLEYCESCQYKIVNEDYSYLSSLLHRYGKGEKISFNKIIISYPYGTDLYKRIWNIARGIPYGEVRSYKWISMKLGSPNYSRVVGNAMAVNPVMIVVPCHRVIKSDGRVGGFSSGVELKKFLLRLEGIKIVEDKVVNRHRYI